MNKSVMRLMFGFKKFHEKYFNQIESENSVYRKLATEGQTPKTLLIGCSDSRVDPAIMTGAAPGELFVVRNVANLVPPFEASAKGFRGVSSAIEFAVLNLKVENIIVLGHRQCGGVRALMRSESTNSESFVSQWMSIAKEARQNVISLYSHLDEDSQCRHAEMESIKVSIKNLKSFPFVEEAVQSGRLSLLGIYFDLEQGQLFEFEEVSNHFKPIEL